MTKPLVSICCITYNHEKYIRDCLEGFVSQKTDFPFEVLIHDDASTDRTADIIREYEKKYPEIIKPIYQTRNQHSQGIRISATYNYPRAQGEFFAICEGDDYWNSPDKLQKQIDMFRARPELAMVYCDYNIRDEIANREIPAVLERQSPPEMRAHAGCLTIEEVVGGKCRIATASCMCRRKVFMGPIIPFEKRDGISLGDLFFKIDSMIYGGIGYIPEAMVTYRVINGSATHTGDVAKAMKFEWDVLKIREYYCGFCQLPKSVCGTIIEDELNRLSRLALLKYSPENVRRIRETAAKYDIILAFPQRCMLVCGNDRVLSLTVCSVIAFLKSIRSLIRRRRSLSA